MLWIWRKAVWIGLGLFVIYAALLLAVVISENRGAEFSYYETHSSFGEPDKYYILLPNYANGRKSITSRLKNSRLFYLFLRAFCARIYIING